MRIHHKRLGFLILAGLLLILCSCTGAPGEGASLDSSGVAVIGLFRQEDGAALSGSIIRISSEGQSVDHPLDEEGEARVSGLPRNGSFALTVLDGQEQPQGEMSITFSEGAVIDAASDESGNGRVTVREDTEEISLVFCLRDDGTLQCALLLDGAG